MDSYSVEFEKVHIKEWKRDVYVRPLSFEEQLKWEEENDEKNPGKTIAFLVSMSVCDESGNPLWNVDQVNKLPAKIVRRLHYVCARVSSLRKKDYEELQKNSEADQPD